MDITQIKQQMTNFITDGKSEDFPQMALTLFNFQFNHNLDYQNFVSPKARHLKLCVNGKIFLPYL